MIKDRLHTQTPSSRCVGTGKSTALWLSRYDLNGNLTSDGLNTYSCDARNRLTQITGPEVSAGDADGVWIAHISEMFSLKGGGIWRPATAVGVAAGHFAQHNTRHADGAHVNNRPMVNDFLNARAEKQ